MTTEETQVNAAPEIAVFVPLYKNVYETNGKKLISYKPGFKSKKEEGKIGTFPVGLGIEYETVIDGDFSRQEYARKFWTSVSVNENKKTEEDPSIFVTLNEVDTKDYIKIGLFRKIKDGVVSYTSGKPIDISSNKYWVNLSKNTKQEKPQDMNLVFKEAAAGETSIGSEADIDFGWMDF